MIQHIVLFKFSNHTTREQKEEGMRRLRKLTKELPGILDLHTNFGFSELAKGYEVGLAVQFTDMAAFENYDPSDEHQAVVSYLKEIGLTDVLELNFHGDAEDAQ